MSAFRVPPAWQLPEGVNAPLWQYTHTPRLAAEEDAYFCGSPAVPCRRPDPRRAVRQRRAGWWTWAAGRGDTPSGSRERGFSGRRRRPVAADARDRRPEGGRGRGRAAPGRGEPLPAGLLPRRDLRLRPLDVQHAGDDPRTRARVDGRWANSRRILRPGGRLALHAHNLWLNLRDRQGRAWLVKHAVRSIFARDELGERRMTYRGIPGMRVHLYRWGELKRSLRRAGFRIDEVLPLDEVSSEPIPMAAG